jgi:hypothetical protein
MIGLLVVGAHVASSASDPLDEWQWRNPLPNGNGFWVITYANDTFVGVEGDNTVASSVDGTNWVTSTPGTNYSLEDIAWGNGVWVAVGLGNYPDSDGGGNFVVILTSPDLITWTQQTAPPDVDGLSGIVYANGLFVAVGSGDDLILRQIFGAILTSQDGVNWVQENSGTTDSYLNNVIYGNGLFVVDSAWHDTILTSPDGVNWTVSDTGMQFWTSSGLTYANGLYVVVGSSGILASPDGSIWTQASTIGSQAITYGNGLFVAVSGNGQIQTSADGFKWTQSGKIRMGAGRILDISYGNGTFVAVGLGVMAVSTDGIDWTNLASAVTTRDLQDVAYGAGSFMAVGDDGAILTSDDGAFWYTYYTGITNNPYLDAVIYGGGSWIAVGSDGTLLHNWRNVTDAADSLWDLTYGDGQFVTLGSEGGADLILTSTNGNAWVIQDSGLTYVNGIAYGNGLFVAGTGAGFLTSPDGVVWTEQNFSDTNASLDGLAYGNGVFVAVGYNGLILTSSDGVTWATNSSGTSVYLLSVTYGDGTFLVTGFSGTLLTSTNGTNWVSRNSGTINNLWGAAFGRNTFVVVGDSGTILQSGIMPSVGAQLSSVPGWANGVFGLTLSGPLGGQWELQASTDLQNWISLGTVMITNTRMPFIDSGATNFSQRFYRAVSP